MKAGGKRSSRNFKVEHGDDPATQYKAACDHAQGLGKNYSVEIRGEKNVRCDRYCSVAPFCEQYQALITVPEEETPDVLSELPQDPESG